jgi:hypothetical protein
MKPPKHRARVLAVTHGRTPWPKHRDDSNGPAPVDGMTEYQAKWVAAMKVREREIHLQQMARCN